MTIHRFTTLRVARGAILAAFLVGALAGCQPGTGPMKGSLELRSCRLKGIETEALCGTHEVWEDREAKSGRRIRIRVAVIPGKLRARESDPIVLFAGGPGQSAIALASQMMPVFSRLNDSRDILLVDQRGTGDSNALVCDEDRSVSVQSLFEDSIPEKMLRDCLAGLDADPRHYATTSAMGDLEEIRVALGYARLNLWGGSYGTRAALEYLRLYPDRVRTAVLDGVAPATMKLPLSFVTDGEAALNALLDACAADPRCEGAYPKLRRSLGGLRDELARRAISVSVVDPVTGRRETVEVTEKVLLNALFRPLYVPQLASLIPFAVDAARAGNYNPLLAQNFEIVADVAEKFAFGMHLSVICSEDIPRITTADIAALQGAFFGRGMVESFVAACRLWPRASVPAAYYEPVRAATPVLVLSGGNDPATPPRHGTLAASTLPNARHLVAPRLGHGVSSHGCAPRLVEQFIRKASAAELDGRCLERMPSPTFVLPIARKP